MALYCGAMSKTFRPYSLDQQLLLPPDLRSWLPEGHLALYVSDVVEALDLAAITRVYAEADPRGGTLDGGLYTAYRAPASHTRDHLL